MAAGVPVYPLLEKDNSLSSRKIWEHLKAAFDGSTFAKVIKLIILRIIDRGLTINIIIRPKKKWKKNKEERQRRE